MNTINSIDMWFIHNHMQDNINSLQLVCSPNLVSHPPNTMNPLKMGWMDVCGFNPVHRHPIPSSNHSFHKDLGRLLWS